MAVVDCELEKELKQFDETKAGVKGLVDAGVTKLPRMFRHPPETLPSPNQNNGVDSNLQVPVIDLKDVDICERRKEIINDLRKAAEEWGFFQIVNHGIPIAVMDEVLKGVRGFHELPQEAKEEWYSRDFKKKVNFFSNGELKVSTPADWRDTLSCKVLEDECNFEAIPEVCREQIREYMKYIVKVQEKLSKLFSEALGLDSDYLENLRCFKSRSLACHYYPVCPDPHLTLGGTRHSDLGFLTLLLQDSSGLQILHDNVWIDVPPVEGALLTNLADMLQIVTNGKFKSVEHRVLMPATLEPRTSIACFVGTDDLQKPYGPIKELISEDNPAIYKEVLFGEYMNRYKL
ncbi:unnamed protein product [Prunus armeniaca]|uniref:Fe2OG dioxygenase domain-containing protein n=2 Tax=Prunus TaxID=3754 RepID=A0A6J5VQJ6_PRUAR|nr:PREDICTED: 1-aminocyclopropane-1-carboxylate oxidase homolog 1-like [Prunus mume]CAB4291540.1 unnamed protein product [Prunus armeniaca]CAB4321857.1 unnamed protein product [Prunus armeniaca]